MGFFKSAIFLLVTLYFILQVSAKDDIFIPKECQTTKTNSISEATDSKKDTAIILIKCLTTQANTLSSNMSELASSERDHTTKSFFKECVEDYTSAKGELESAKVSLMNNNVVDAVKGVVAAAKANVHCHKVLIMSVLRKPQGKAVFYKMMAYDELSETVKRIIASISY